MDSFKIINQRIQRTTASNEPIIHYEKIIIYHIFFSFLLKKLNFFSFDLKRRQTAILVFIFFHFIYFQY